ncbi:MAG: hypothetical protein AAGA46_00540 [Cyanobacteria bacterium P01_F01_bin.13]
MIMRLSTIAAIGSPSDIPSLPPQDFLITGRQGAGSYANSDTIFQQLNTFQDLEVAADPRSTATSISVIYDGEPLEDYGISSTLATANGWSIRINPVPLGLKPLVITVGFDDATEQVKTLYVGAPENVPVGVLDTNIVDGQFVTTGDTVSLTMSLPTPNPGAVLETVTIGVYRQESGGVHTPLNSKSFPNADSAGVQGIDFVIPQHGTFLVRQVNHWNPEPDEIIDAYVYNPEPSDTPATPSLTIYETDLFEDVASIGGHVWTDSERTGQQWLEVSGVDYPMEALTSLRGLQLTPSALGMNSPNVYNLRWKATYSDTNPETIFSNYVSVLLKPVPADVLVDSALNDSGDNTKWDAIIQSTETTPRQKEIAQQAIALNNEINNGLFDTGQTAVNTTQAIANRNTWAQEQTDSGNPLTFQEWLAAQTVWDAAEQNQTREFLLEAPTSSVDALLNYLNSTIAPFGSHLQSVLAGRWGIGGGDYEFIRDNSQRYGGRVPSNVVTGDYARYQSALPAMSPVIEFETWIKSN